MTHAASLKPRAPVASRRRGSTQRQRAWRHADHDDRRRMILDVALELLEKHGAEGMTIRRVAAKLGVGAMTLYTYVNGQDGLRRELVRRGFEALSDGCRAASEAARGLTEPPPHPWWPGARNYIAFAVDHPAWFRLMFDTPLPRDAAAPDREVLVGGFAPLRERVRDALAEHEQLTGDTLEREARRVAGRYWIGIHGLAMLATTGRLDILEGDLDALLADLLPGVAPPVDQPTASDDAR